MFMNEAASVGLFCDELKFCHIFFEHIKCSVCFLVLIVFCVRHVGSSCNKGKTSHSRVCLGRAKFRFEDLAAFES